MVSVVCEAMVPLPDGMTTGRHFLSLHTYSGVEVSGEGYERQPVDLVAVEGPIVSNDQEVVFPRIPPVVGLARIGVWNSDGELVLMIPFDVPNFDQRSREVRVAKNMLRIPV